MTKSRTKQLLSHFMLILALAFIASSGFISYFVVGRAESKVVSLSKDIDDKQALIREIWGNIVSKENTANMAILLSFKESAENHELETLKAKYLQQFSNLPPIPSNLDIYASLEKEKASDRAYINDVYLQQSKLQSELNTLKQQSKKYADIAFFLQIISLVMIILRNQPVIG